MMFISVMPWKDPAKQREYSRQWYKRNLERERAKRKTYREAHLEETRKRTRQYHISHRELERERGKQYYKEHREEVLARMNSYQLKRHKDYEARYKARYAVPLESQCLLCGSTKNLERHHPNYAEPLKVLTLCHTCHNRLHLGVDKHELLRTLETKNVLQNTSVGLS